MSDTKLYFNQQPGGQFTVVDKEFHPGNIWFVGSTVSAASNAVGFGRNPTAPFATLVYAETQVSAGDTIFVMPGHAETLTGNPSLTLDVAGLSVIGLGGWSRRPTFLIDGAATAHILMSGADTVIQNVILNAGHQDVAKAISIIADGCVVRGCFFKENTADENFLIGINVGAADNDADGTLIEDNVFYAPDTDNTHAIWILKDQSHVTISGNQIEGAFVADSAPIGAPGTEVCLNLAVIGNLIDNRSADGVHAIEFAAANTGIMARNLSGDIDGDGTPFIGTGMSLCENYHTGAVTTSGFIYPAIDS